MRKRVSRIVFHLQWFCMTYTILLRIHYISVLRVGQKFPCSISYPHSCSLFAFSWVTTLTGTTYSVTTYNLVRCFDDLNDARTDNISSFFKQIRNRWESISKNNNNNINNNVKKQQKGIKRKERVGYGDEVDYWNIFAKCFEKYFERNCCLHQSDFGEQWIPIWLQEKIFHLKHLIPSRKTWGLGVNEILNKHWK